MSLSTIMAAKAPDQFWDAIKTVHYTYPALVILYFVVALAATVCTVQTKKLRIQDQNVRRGIIHGLIFGAGASYTAEAILVAVRSAVQSGWHAREDRVFYLIASSVAFGAQGLALTDSKFPVWYPYYGTWFIGAVFELALLILPTIFTPSWSSFDYVTIVLQILRVVNFLALIGLFFKLRNDTQEYDNSDEERQSLLKKKRDPKQGDAAGYGAVAQESDNDGNVSDADSEDSYCAKERKAKEKIAKRLRQDGNWFTYAKGFTIFLPYLWPFHNKRLQLRAVLVAGCLLSSNAFHVLVPNQMGIMIDSLTKYAQGDHEHNIWLPVAIYAALLFIGGGSCIGWLQKWLWMPLEQFSYNALSTASHAHLMNLSSDFHDNKTSSDLSQAIHGGRNVADLMETICFQVVPMFIDLAVAFIYLWSLMGPYMGMIMLSTVVLYLWLTTKLYAQKADKRREYITVFRKEWTVAQQSLDGWTTASLFNMIPHESQKYAGSVQDHMKSKGIFEMSSYTINAIQSLILTLGLLGALSLGAYQVAYGGKTVGQFSTLLVYWGQLQSPVVFFSTMYRQISYSLMDAERLLELFQTKPTIIDSPAAEPLKLSQGLVKFDNVTFAYDERKPTLKDVSFVVPAGKTVALVGETGGGKSTILKLMDRFYDVKGGTISIDGQDIRNVTLDSLRSKIGVVPQEPMLFNDSIINNIRYARLSATDEEVYEACRAAAVHDKIMGFPDGYNSKVGDRGVKLSGGEKQRVAIARAILKQPEIILLDEATSAVDTETEQHIQEGFKNLCNGRTTFVVA
jgi:ABC-type transport system involved in Fe-S cluster assembly fused permease/ATPase subunit